MPLLTLEGPRVVDRRRIAGSVSSASARASAVALAQARAAELLVPLVIVGESWTAGWRQDRSHARTIAGLGASWGRWEAALEDAGIRKASILRVGTSTWRARVLGGPSRRTTDAWKSSALHRATISLATTETTVMPASAITADAAEATCIALWAERAGEVGLALPATTLRAALARPEDAELLALLEQRRGLAPTTTRPDGR